jgi:methionyl-tRNA formyltransferase
VTSDNYIVCTVHQWNVENYHENFGSEPNFYLINNKDELTIEKVKSINPKYIFFPHWSWIVPNNILESFECVCFHMTDLPYGRGGSPLQNLIVRGVKETQISALRMTKVLDGGPVYLKEPLSLNGKAENIYKKASKKVFYLIKRIIETSPDPTPQQGEVVEFKRRTPDQSCIPENLSNEQFYDYIRMLDAPSYPRAFLEFGDKKLLFSDAEYDKENDSVIAKVKIISKEVL